MFLIESNNNNKLPNVKTNKSCYWLFQNLNTFGTLVIFILNTVVYRATYNDDRGFIMCIKPKVFIHISINNRRV